MSFQELQKQLGAVSDRFRGADNSNRMLAEQLSIFTSRVAKQEQQLKRAQFVTSHMQQGLAARVVQSWYRRWQARRRASSMSEMQRALTLAEETASRHQLHALALQSEVDQLLASGAQKQTELERALSSLRESSANERSLLSSRFAMATNRNKVLFIFHLFVVKFSSHQ